MWLVDKGQGVYSFSWQVLELRLLFLTIIWSQSIGHLIVCDGDWFLWPGEKVLVSRLNIWIFMADPTNLACSAGHSCQLVGPKFLCYCQSQSGSISVRLCSVFLVKQFPHFDCFRQAVLLLHRQGSWKLLAKGFSSQVRLCTCVLGVHSLGPSVWGKLCCSFTDRVLGNSHPHPPKNYSRVFRWASQSAS